MRKYQLQSLSSPNSRLLNPVILGLVLYFACFMSPCSLRAEEVNKTKLSLGREAAHQHIFALALGILKDPIMPDSIRGGVLKEIPQDGRDEQNIQQVARKFSFLTYDIHSIGKTSSVQSCNMIFWDDERYHLSLFLSNDERSDPLENLDWKMVTSACDDFVSRFWPGSSRQNDYQKALENFQPGRGVFTLEYELKQENFVSSSVSIDVRLSDGKLGGLKVIDYRPYISRLLQDPATPPKLADKELLTVIDTAITSRIKQGDLPFSGINKLKIKELSRRYGKPLAIGSPKDGKVETFISDLIVLGDSNDGETFRIELEYDEIKKRIFISDVQVYDIENGGSGRPLTTVADSKPFWSVDGNELYFVTTRDVEKRPWWQRDSILKSIAVMRANDKNRVTLLRPIRPIRDDFFSYGLVSVPGVSPFLMASLDGTDNQLILIDKEKGQCVLPKQSNSWKNNMLKSLPSAAYLPREVDWIISSGSKSHTGQGALLSMCYGWPDYDIYSIQEADTGVPEFDLFPIATDRKEEMFPSLSGDDKLLSYVQGGEETNNWQFIVADYDNIELKMSNKRTVDLPEAPTSVSWDDNSHRWLVVLKSGQMVWVSNDNGKLSVGRINPLKWGELSLRPMSADVSLQGNKIALAAELGKPQTFKDSECIVHTLIFLWDGKSSQVLPAYDPSLNGIPRYTFLDGSPWAKVEGDVQKYGLSGIADPAYFINRN